MNEDLIPQAAQAPDPPEGGEARPGDDPGKEPRLPSAGEAPQRDARLEDLARENENLREALRRTREEAELRQRQSLAARSLRDALARRGAMPGAVELLAASVPGETLLADGDGGERAAEDLQRRYGFLFRPETLVPTPRADPPRIGGVLGPDSLRGMSEAEINRSWSEVREALREGRR